MKSLYEDLKEAGVEINNHYSDLYCEVNETTTRIIKAHNQRAEVFKDQVTGKMCYDIFGAYLPYWESKQK